MKTAIIIGAGPAGLTAAYELLRNNTGDGDDICPIVLEATEEFGGLSRTHVSNNKRLDIGGHRFFTKSDPVLELWLATCPAQGAPARDDIALERARTSVQGGPDPETTERVMLRRGRLSRFLYQRKLWFSAPSPEESPGRGQGLRKVFAHLLFGSREKTATPLIDEFYYPKLGTGQLWEALAVDIQAMGGDFYMGSRVAELQTEDGRVTSVRVETPGGGYTLAGDYFFSSMPIKDLIAALPADSMPPTVREAAAALPYRSFITVGLMVDQLAMSNETDIPTLEGLLPDCWLYIQDRDVKLERLQIINNWSPYMTGGLSGVWLGLEYFCAEGDELWTMENDELIDMAVGELIKVGVLSSQQQFRDGLVLRESKARPDYGGGYENFQAVRSYLDGFENLYCIGSNGQHRYLKMDHAMLTAMTAARLARERSTDRSALWSVEIEDDGEGETP